MKYPLPLDESSSGSVAQSGQCLVCRRELNEESANVAFVSGGALRQIDRETSVPAADLMAFLTLGLRGAQGDEGEAPSVSVSIADEIPNGQFEFCFCSTACMREFFNACVDAVEEKLA